MCAECHKNVTLQKNHNYPRITLYFLLEQIQFLISVFRFWGDMRDVSSLESHFRADVNLI